jgi:hypothetical protein
MGFLFQLVAELLFGAIFSFVFQAILTSLGGGSTM